MLRRERFCHDNLYVRPSVRLSCDVEASWSCWNFWKIISRLNGRCALDSAQLNSAQPNSAQLNPAQLISARARLLVGLLWLAGAHFLVGHIWNLPAHSIHRLNVAWNNCFRFIFRGFWRESVRTCQFYCSSVPVSYILVWKRHSIVEIMYSSGSKRQPTIQ